MQVSETATTYRDDNAHSPSHVIPVDYLPTTDTNHFLQDTKNTNDVQEHQLQTQGNRPSGTQKQVASPEMIDLLQNPQNTLIRDEITNPYVIHRNKNESPSNNIDVMAQEALQGLLELPQTQTTLAKGTTKTKRAITQEDKQQITGDTEIPSRMGTSGGNPRRSLRIASSLLRRIPSLPLGARRPRSQQRKKLGKGFRALSREATNLGLGETKYYLVIVFSTVLWQYSFLGAIGVISCANMLLAGILIAVFIPLVEILSVIFLHEKFNIEKGLALVLSLWGLASYSYGEYREGKERTKLAGSDPHTTPV
ncbi:Purine permease 3 [Platanthera zijinensis]|uniref:Probable purine permease n=1 Tax=Platanthera zijinensis TaxID=2320716 RepID=A0AAP0BFS0_9ASPA